MSKDSWLKAGSFSLLANIAQLGFNFLAFLVLVRILSQDDFGVWVLYLTLTSFAEMTRIGFVQNGFVKFYSASNDRERKEWISTAFVLSTLVGLVGALFLWGLSFVLADLWSADILTQIVPWYILYAFLFGSLKLTEFIQIAKQDFRGVFVANVLYGIFFLGGILYYWYFELNIALYRLIIFQSIAALVALVFILLYQTSYFQFGVFNRIFFWKLFHFGKYVFGTNFSSMLFNRMDVMMLGAFINPIAVSLYNVASRVNNYMEVPMNSLAQVIYPRIAERQKEGLIEVSKLYEKSVALLFLISMPIAIFVFLFAEPIIIILAGQEYLEATIVLKLLVLAGLIKPWGRLFGITLDAIGQPVLNFKMLIVSLLFNISLNATLIPIMGLEGAAVATLLAIWITIILGQFLLSKRLKINHFNIFRLMIEYIQSVTTILKIKLKPKSE
ncbi:MAG: flippase [Saprospiraceae bacterium]|nr:flippase [Saprospiraceae bacterium]